MSPNRSDYDLVIVGAGPVGCALAERAASQRGWRVLIVEKRSHIAGNCYDSLHENGVMIHNYGPHFFRTNSKELIKYLSQFTEWVEGDYQVRTEVNGQLYPFPINLNTLEKFFGVEGLDADSAQALLDSKRQTFKEPANSEEFVLSRVGREMYEAFYLEYTKKMWDKHPSELDASVCGRIPIKMDRDPYYVTHTYRQLPKAGYTAMFAKMVDHPLIEIALDTDYFDVAESLNARIATVYTGPIDTYFKHCYGKLEWRSLEFFFEAHEQEFVQPCAVINYPDERPFTRSVEIKHITKQKHKHTVVCSEIPRAKGDPYYPIPDQRNRALYLKYKQLADNETGVYFKGRLAEYTYINTDEAIEKGLEFFQTLSKSHKS